MLSIPDDKPDDITLTLEAVSDDCGRLSWYATTDAANRTHAVSTSGSAYSGPNPFGSQWLLQASYQFNHEHLSTRPSLPMDLDDDPANYDASWAATPTNPKPGLASITTSGNMGVLSANSYACDVLGNRTANAITDQNGDTCTRPCTRDFVHHIGRCVALRSAVWEAASHLVVTVLLLTVTILCVNDF